ncbi:type II secretion system minor pseudopilin GspK [Celerinatantimonas sp. YJH-8]|uniref:type II secretion system minor pseudopilin GspK n=1 Tax=Celerinatantimonas sp. YJH-8 TaxID=3228714 RepID=UPI0038CAEC53
MRRVRWNRRARQQGVALLVVMLIIVMMILITSRLSNRLSVDIERVSQVQAQSDNWQRLLSGEALAVGVLRYDMERSTELSLAQDWASQHIQLPVSGGMLRGQIVDQRTCFNLNALAQPNNRGAQSMVQMLFTRLLMIQGVSSSQARDIAAATRDWVDSDQDTISYGAEDRAYHDAHYRTSDAPLVSKSQWREVQGVSAEIYRNVSPLLCVLPSERLLIDINTIQEAQAPLLEMLFYGYVNHHAALAVIRRRPHQGYQRVLQMMASPELAKVRLEQGVLRTMTTTSRYFLVKLQAQTEDGQVSSLNSLVVRRGVSNMHVVRRTLGDWD